MNHEGPRRGRELVMNCQSVSTGRVPADVDLGEPGVVMAVEGIDHRNHLTRVDVLLTPDQAADIAAMLLVAAHDAEHGPD
jgi:hypothetical protein